MRYHLVQVLKDGPSCKTFLAKTNDGQKVVIKQLKSSTAQIANQNHTEANILRALNHPQIPQHMDEYHENVEGKRRLHLVREYVDGIVLSKEIEAQKYTFSKDWQDVYQILVDLLSIVAYIQSVTPPIIHRDIKPSNLIRRRDGQIVLIDFDVATNDLEQTFGHDFAGTIGYQSPEQIAGEPSIQSDVYSVGALAVELLTNQKPRTLMKGMHLHWESACEDIPPKLYRWLEKMLDSEQSQRFSSAREAKTALMQLEGEKPLSGKHTSNLSAPDNVDSEFLKNLKEVAAEHLQTERQKREQANARKNRQREAKRRQSERDQKRALSSARQKQQIKQRAEVLRQEIRKSFDALISEIGGGRIPLERGLEFFWDSYKAKLQLRIGKSIVYVITEEMLILSAFLKDIEVPVNWDWKAHYAYYLTQRLAPTSMEHRQQLDDANEHINSLKQEISHLGFFGNLLKKTSLEQDLQDAQQKHDDLVAGLQEEAWDTIKSRCQLFSITKQDFTRRNQYDKEFTKFKRAFVASILVGLTNEFGIGDYAHEMVYLPSGEFMMGAVVHDTQALESEKPCHKVSLRNGFWLGKYPVTQVLFQAITGKKPSYFAGPDHPVETVSWCDAVLFCNMLSKKEGLETVYKLPQGFGFEMDFGKSKSLAQKIVVDWEANGYRLPTEAEWEYAARAGEYYLYAGGNKPDDVGWYGSCFWNGNDWENSTGGNSKKTTHPVGMKQPNAYKIYDMTGNIFEWVWDRFDAKAYRNRKTTTTYDPKGPRNGEARIVKGGCWYKTPKYARVSFRSSSQVGTRFQNTGFRLLRRS